VVEKFGRVHHHVNYEVFKDNPKPRLRPGLEMDGTPNNYGMALEYVDGLEVEIDEEDDAPPSPRKD
jgi:hypothetical protein